MAAPCTRRRHRAAHLLMTRPRRCSSLVSLDAKRSALAASYCGQALATTFTRQDLLRLASPPPTSSMRSPEMTRQYWRWSRMRCEMVRRRQSLPKSGGCRWSLPVACSLSRPTLTPRFSFFAVGVTASGIRSQSHRPPARAGGSVARHRVGSVSLGSAGHAGRSSSPVSGAANPFL